MSQLPKTCTLNTLYNEDNEDIGYANYLGSDVKHFNDSNLSFDKDNIKLVLPRANKGKLEIMIFHEPKRKWVVEQIDNFCIDQFYTDFENGVELHQNPNNFLVIFCPNEDDQECEEPDSLSYKFTISWVYIAFSLLALVFLLATIIVYAVLWDKHNFHGITIASYTIATFGCYLYLMIAHLISLYPEPEVTGLHNRGALCYTVGMH